MATVREADGLAMSSRNAYLSPEERKRALSLSRALRAAGECVQSGCAHHRAACGCGAGGARAHARCPEIEYVEAVDAETLKPRERFDRPVVVAIAARVGKTRLIDNVVLSLCADVGYAESSHSQSSRIPDPCERGSSTASASDGEVIGESRDRELAMRRAECEE